MFNSAADIKRAIDDGLHVKWATDAYDCIKDNLGQYLIICRVNDYCIGLTWQDGETLTGQLDQFYIVPGRVTK